MKQILLSFLVVILLLLTGCESTDSDSVDAPYDLTVEKIAEGRLKITWDYSNSANDLNYVIQRKVGTAEYGTFTNPIEVKQFIDEIETNTYEVIVYRVVAFWDGDQQQSEPSDAVAYFSDFAVPSDLALTQVSQDVVELQWVDNIIGEDGYFIDKKLDDGEWEVKYASVPEGVTVYQDSVHALWETVTYRVYAHVEDSYSKKITAQSTPSFPAPSGLNLAQVYTTQIRLQWEDNSDGESGFEIQRRIGDKDWSYLNSVGSDETEYVDEPNIESGSISYRVRAYQTATEGNLTSSFSEIQTVNFNLTQINTTNLPIDQGSVTDIACFEHYLYIVTGWDIQIIDIADQENPTLVNEFQIDGDPVAAEIDDDYLFIMNNSDKGLFIYSLSDPENPDYISKCELSSLTCNFYDIEIAEINDKSYAFVASGIAGVFVIDLMYERDFNPIVVKQISSSSVCYQVEFEDNVIYTAEGESGIYIYDVSDPINPVKLDNNGNIGHIQSFSLSGNRVYSASSDRGLIILDKNNLNTISSLDTQGIAKSIQFSSNYAYIADYDNGIIIIDVQDENDLYHVAHIETQGNANVLFLRNSFLYALTDQALEIIKIRP